ncbi:ANTAR domain-containing protein [Geodermatophilus sp. SYSU D00815]
MSVRGERTGAAAACPETVQPPELPAGADALVAVVRTGRGWSVVCPDGATAVSSLVEGLSLADLLGEEFGIPCEPDRTARRSARGRTDEAGAEDPRDARIAALERTVAQLEHALAARVSTERAIGVLAEREGVSPRTAFEDLRRSARSSGRPVHELAREVLESLPDDDAATEAAPDTGNRARPEPGPALVRDAVPAGPAPRPRPPFGRRPDHARPRSAAAPGAGDGRS